MKFKRCCACKEHRSVSFFDKGKSSCNDCILKSKKNRRVEKGILYVITNSTVPNWIKVGRTKVLKGRMFTYNSSTPFDVITLEYESIELSDYAKAEDMLLQKMGVPDGRKEWYKCDKNRAIAIICYIESLEEDGLL